MGDSKAQPGFGQVDLDIGDDPVAPSPSAPPQASAFGSVNIELGEPDEPAPRSTSRVFNAGTRPAPARPVSIHDESTRIVSGDALSAITRPPPPPGPHDDGSTRAWADIDAAFDDDSSAPLSGNQPAPSASGVATRDDRVAAMRELYARGDAAGALALASTLVHTVALDSGSTGDSPDASIVVEFGEMSIAIDDPFGGLVPLDEEDEPAPLSNPMVTMPPPAAHLTLTQRQSIPRRIIELADIATLKIDHRAGFLLTLADGMQTLEEILDVCAMPSAEALALFDKLESLGAIAYD